MKVNFSEIASKIPQRKEQNKYAMGRNACLYGLVIVLFYAVTSFPGYFDPVPDYEHWGLIAMTILSGIVLLYFERFCSSRSGKRPHEWNSSGGTLHAFSFTNCRCAACSSRRVLCSVDGKGRTAYITPGMGVKDGASLGFYCVKCGTVVKAKDCTPEKFVSSKMKRADITSVLPLIRASKPYKLSRVYIKRYVTVAVIILFAEISSFYLARNAAVKLILPAFVGYFLFVSLYNLYTAAVTKYYVLDCGVVQKTPYGYSLFAFNESSSLVRFSEGERLSWGLYTSGENLLISPIIRDYEDMLREIKKKCLEKKIVISEK